jgi:hypothetical protein
LRVKATGVGTAVGVGDGLAVGLADGLALGEGDALAGATEALLDADSEGAAPELEHAPTSRQRATRPVSGRGTDIGQVLFAIDDGAEPARWPQPRGHLRVRSGYAAESRRDTARFGTLTEMARSSRPMFAAPIWQVSCAQAARVTRASSGSVR